MFALDALRVHASTAERVVYEWHEIEISKLDALLCITRIRRYISHPVLYARDADRMYDYNLS